MDHAYNSKTGFALINGVNIWVYSPSDARPEWDWSATRYDGEHVGGCPRFVEGIACIQGRANNEEHAVELATAAAKLIGIMPGNVVVANGPVSE